MANITKELDNSQVFRNEGCVEKGITAEQIIEVMNEYFNDGIYVPFEGEFMPHKYCGDWMYPQEYGDVWYDTAIFQLSPVSCLLVMHKIEDYVTRTGEMSWMATEIVGEAVVILKVEFDDEEID